MRAQTVITHALTQGAGPACMRPGMGTSAAPAPAPRGVSLAKAGDPAPVSRPLVERSPLRNVDVAPYLAWLDGAELDEHAWWGVPAGAVQGWIRDNLRMGRYHRAARLSALLHG